MQEQEARQVSIAMNKAASVIGVHYNKALLDSFFRSYAAPFILNHANFLHDNGINSIWLELAKSKKAIRKEDLSLLCAVPFASKTIFQAFRHALPEDVRRILDSLIWAESMSDSEIRTILGIEIFTEKKKTTYYGSYATSELCSHISDFCFGREVRNYYHYEKPIAALFLPALVRTLFMAFYDKPKYADMVPLDIVPDMAFAFEGMAGTVLSEVIRFKPYVLQDNIKSTTKGKINPASANKTQRVLGIKEFFPDSEDKDIRNLRTSMMASLLQKVSQKYLALPDPVLLKELLGPIYEKQHPVLNVLGYLKGMGYVDDYQDLDQGHLALREMLKALPLGKWVSAENLTEYIHYNLVNAKPISSHAAANRLYFDRTKANGSYTYEYKAYFDSGAYKKFVVTPFIKGMMFFFAAFGVLDIRYNAPKDASKLGETFDSPYDELGYVRLTELGAYLLGLTKTYTPPQDVDSTIITFMEDALVVTTDREDESVGIMLAPFTNRLGPTRFHTDFGIFLTGCRTRKDVEGKIELFRATVGVKLPANWEAFFSEVKKKIDPFHKVSSKYTVFGIPPENKALVELIARDPVLKKSVLKAENFHILVHKNDMAAFKKRLQEFGYVLE